ncbi:Part of AAA domain-containing protein [Thalassovita taeanensis]|uniref:Part of AAA domain-containing protein n=1 Tax=Thalassovita taeanensis TaxID=657014 RepID=A0A1H9IT29_9RHOB|nr:Part of AAA domain-containing protein [Thalassovita taeanensis]
MTGHPTIPEVTDEDIAWVADTMGLDDLDGDRRAFLKRTGTFDVSACPGSGKTTLVVAKLAILARKWHHPTSGICVLSHTNVAREEIQNRLGHTPVGHRLLRYPHFIDTIHTFANRFLALPYLRSNGFPSPLVDDDVAKAFRWNVLQGQERWRFEGWLKRRHKSIDEITFRDSNLSVAMTSGDFPTGAHTETYKKAQRIIVESAAAGHFRYEEMFVWAECVLGQFPEIAASLSHRFPLVLMDEMQDTSQRQAALLGSIFDRTNGPCFVQRVGDPNQEIFKSGQEQNTADPFPDVGEGRTMSVGSSRRFGAPVADLANPLAIVPIDGVGLQGGGPQRAAEFSEHNRNLIIIFPDNNTDGVLDVFGTHLLETFDDETIAIGDCVAIGGVHRPAPEAIAAGHAKFPRSVEHYWGGYSPEVSKSDLHPKTLVGYIHHAQIMIRMSGDTAGGIAHFATGLKRLTRQIGKPERTLERTRKHMAIRSVLAPIPDALARYDQFAQTFLIAMTPVTEEIWQGYAQQFRELARQLCQGDVDLDAGAGFLAWEDPQADLPELESAQANIDNIVKVSSGDREVSIRLGSIHQAKGQTHFATLLLSTYLYDHSSEKIIRWLTGEKSGGNGEVVRNLSRLKQSYVAMTRPTHLVAMALRNSAIAADRAKALEQLRARGWEIRDLCT